MTKPPIEELPPTEGWLMQCPPGLAPVLGKELIFAGAVTREQKPFVKHQRNHDLVFLNHAKKTDGMGRLRIAEVVLQCPAYGKFKISKRQLDVMAGELKRLGSRRLVVSCTGKQFQRHDLLRFLNREISARGFDFDEDIESEVWMFCIDESWYFGIPMKKARDIEGREERESERQGSLPPSSAAALAFAAVPRDEDVVWDATCGSGTVLAEFYGYRANARLFGTDIDPEAIEVARTNLSNVKIAQLNVADSTLGAPVEGLTLTICNLPFGKQFGAQATNRALYEGILRASLDARDAEKNWRGIFLTSDTENFTQAVQAVGGLISERLFGMKVRGETATAYRVKTRD